MTDKEKIIAEIRKRLLPTVHERSYDEWERGGNNALINILNFIYSLPEDPVSKDLDEAGRKWLLPQLDTSYKDYGETKMMELTHFDGYAMLDAIEFGAKWMAEQGITVEGLVICDEKLTYGYKDIVMSIPDTLKVGDKVTVQIRKRVE